MVLLKKKRTSRWLFGMLRVIPSTVSNWFTTTSQPNVASLLKISDLLELDTKELIIREYKQSLLSKEQYKNYI